MVSYSACCGCLQPLVPPSHPPPSPPPQGPSLLQHSKSMPRSVEFTEPLEAACGSGAGVGGSGSVGGGRGSSQGGGSRRRRSIEFSGRDNVTLSLTRSDSARRCTAAGGSTGVTGGGSTSGGLAGGSTGGMGGADSGSATPGGSSGTVGGTGGMDGGTVSGTEGQQPKRRLPRTDPAARVVPRMSGGGTIEDGERAVVGGLSTLCCA